MTSDTPAPPILFRTWEPATIALGARTLRLRVKRMTVDEFAEFDRLFYRVMQRDADRMVLVRRPGEEQERISSVVVSQEQVDGFYATLEMLSQAGTTHIARRAEQTITPTERAKQLHLLCEAILGAIQPNERFVIEDEEIRRRRLLEMNEHERHNYERMLAEDRAAFETAVCKGLHAFVRVEPGQLSLENEVGEVEDVTTGAQLELCLGAFPDHLFRVLMAIRSANALSDDEKNGSGSPSPSESSSNERGPKTPGASSTPAETAVPTPSATTAGATGRAKKPSGGTTS